MSFISFGTQGMEINLTLPTDIKNKIDYPQLQHLMHKEFEDLWLLSVNFSDEASESEIVRIFIDWHNSEISENSRKRILRVVKEAIKGGNIVKTEVVTYLKQCLRNSYEAEHKLARHESYIEGLESQLFQARKKLKKMRQSTRSNGRTALYDRNCPTVCQKNCPTVKLLKAELRNMRRRMHWKNTVDKDTGDKDTVDIDSRNENRNGNYGTTNSVSRLPFPLGTCTDSKTMSADLTKLPHLLIAGASHNVINFYMNTIIATLILKHTPEKLRLLLIDSIKSDLAKFKDIPHLKQDIITAPDDAISALKKISLVMERRYEHLSNAGTRNIECYNQQALDDSVLMPYIVIAIGELSHLMKYSANESEASICRLAQMGKAVGIHLIVATQNISTPILTDPIKLNIPSKVAFTLDSSAASKLVLKRKGAESLANKEEMLYISPKEPMPVHIRGKFITNDKIEKIISQCEVK